MAVSVDGYVSCVKCKERRKGVELLLAVLFLCMEWQLVILISVYFAASSSPMCRGVEETFNGGNVMNPCERRYLWFRFCRWTTEKMTFCHLPFRQGFQRWQRIQSIFRIFIRNWLPLKWEFRYSSHLLHLDWSCDLFDHLHRPIRMSETLRSPVISAAMALETRLRWYMSQTLWNTPTPRWMMLQSICNHLIIVLTMQITPGENGKTNRNTHLTFKKSRKCKHNAMPCVFIWFQMNESTGEEMK